MRPIESYGSADPKAEILRIARDAGPAGLTPDLVRASVPDYGPRYSSAIGRLVREGRLVHFSEQRSARPEAKGARRGRYALAELAVAIAMDHMAEAAREAVA